MRANAAKREEVEQEVENDISGPSTAMATRRTDAPMLGGVTGEGDCEIRPPWMTIVHGTSKTSASFDVGSIILDKTSLLVKKGEPLEVVILSAPTYWKEYTTGPYDPDNRPRQFNSKAEVLEAGGTVTWNNNTDPATPPTFSLAADLRLLVRKPKDIICGMFGEDLLGDGHDYAPALFSIDKTAYKRVMPEIISAEKVSLARRGLRSGVWVLKTGTEILKGKPVIVPSIKLVSALSPEAMQRIEDLFGSVANQTEVEPDAAG
jgi:hypothetical protein